MLKGATRLFGRLLPRHLSTRMSSSSTTTTATPCGTWASPITTQLLTSDFVALKSVAATPDNKHVVWTEARPLEKGRTTLVRMPLPSNDGVVAAEEVLPPSMNVRSTVHEYGGGDYNVADDGHVYFSNHEDARVYRLSLASVATAAVDVDATAICVGVTPNRGATTRSHRYADFIIDTPRQRLIAIQEHHDATGAEATNSIVTVPLPPLTAADADADADAAAAYVAPEPTTLVSGADFYSSVCLSGDGKQLAWLQWSHPAMPWFGCELWTAVVSADGASVTDSRLIAGGSSESVCSATACVCACFTFSCCSFTSAQLLQSFTNHSIIRNFAFHRFFSRRGRHTTSVFTM
jgi:hypothetical protein